VNTLGAVAAAAAAAGRGVNPSYGVVRGGRGSGGNPAVGFVRGGGAENLFGGELFGRRRRRRTAVRAREGLFARPDRPNFSPNGKPVVEQTVRWTRIYFPRL